MSHPPSDAAILERLAALSLDFGAANRPATVVEMLARAVTHLFTPDHLAVVLLDVNANRLTVAHTSGHPVATDDPLLQLALRRGPLVLSRDVAAGAAREGADLGTRPAPASWMGAPLVAVRRTIGAISVGAGRTDAYRDPDLAALRAFAAQAALALENTRLVELLSIGKREWEHTVDTITQAICIVNAHGDVRRANRVFADLIRVPVTAVAGRPWLSLVPPAWADVVARALAQPGTTHEVRAGDRVFLASAIPLPEPGDAVLTFEDQTEKRRLQEQLIQSEKMSAIGQLIAGVAHDLNNPLASVVGFSDFLGEGVDIPPALAEPLQVIRQEAERAATIVKNLLSFARRQAEERRVQAIQPLLESVVALLRNQLMALRVDATLEVDADVPEIEMNANQIKQVFVNLLNNAAQAIAGTGRGGQVRVSAQRWLDGVAVSVADDGPGVPEEIGARVFEPFFSTKPEGEGTGLGLSICQGIIKEHGGRITLESAPQGGATFTVQLPGGVRAPRAAPRSLPVAPGVSLRILVVDDEPHILHYMRATLESWGHRVEVASDGTDALGRALDAPFDVIICDMRMPRLGGREIYQSLAREHPDVAQRVIFATGDTVRGDTLQFLESLDRPFLHKPFTLAELRSVLGGGTAGTGDGNAGTGKGGGAGVAG
jgi:two-component system NtrC family sensor kinase